MVGSLSVLGVLQGSQVPERMLMSTDGKTFSSLNSARSSAANEAAINPPKVALKMITRGDQGEIDFDDLGKMAAKELSKQSGSRFQYGSRRRWRN